MSRVSSPLPYAVVGDPTTMLLLHGDGDNASTAIVDSSSYSRSITRVGNPVIVKNGYLYLSGSTQYLTVPDSIDWSLGDIWTIDFWTKVNSNTDAGFCHQMVDYDNVWGIGYGRPNTLYYWSSNGSGNYSGYNVDKVMDDNIWHHVAVVRNLSNMYIFVDGQMCTQSGTVYPLITMNDLNAPLTIGKEEDYSLTGGLKGFRITKGEALWISNFTPPTTITTTANTKLLLNFNGNTIDESGLGGKGLSLSGNCYLDTTIKRTGTASFRMAETQGMWHGSTATMAQPWGNELNFGTGDFSIESWVYLPTLNTPSNYDMKCLASFFADGSNYSFMGFGSPAGNGQPITRLQWNVGGVGLGLIANATFQANTWFHVKFARQNGVCKIFKDGVSLPLQTATNMNASINFSGWHSMIGSWRYTDYYYAPLNGYLEDFQIRKGSAGAFENFTPQDGVLDSYTTYLYKFDGTQGQTTNIVDSTGRQVTSYGNPKLYDAGAMRITNDGGAIYFNGINDYLSIINSADWNFDTQDFTIEGYVKVDSVMPRNYHYTIIGKGLDNNNNWFCSLYNHEDIQLHVYWYGNTNGVNWNRRLELPLSSIRANQWNHFAVVKTGTTALNIYWNGVGAVQSPVSTGVYSGAEPVNIGYLNLGGWTYVEHFKGYIDELRMSTVPRYTSNFIPPTQAFK